MTRALAKKIIRAERSAIVLWDDDYRNHIARLDERLDRERREVCRLREEIHRLKAKQ